MSVTNITTLFLDNGGVLLSNGWGHVFRHQAAAKFNLDIPEMEARHKNNVEKYEEGNLTQDEYLDEVAFYREYYFTHEAFRNFMFALTTPYRCMIEDIYKVYAESFLGKDHLKQIIKEADIIVNDALETKGETR